MAEGRVVKKKLRHTRLKFDQIAVLEQEYLEDPNWKLDRCQSLADRLGV